MSDVEKLRAAADEAWKAGRLEEALARLAELEALDGDPEWARKAAQAHHRLADTAGEIAALNRAARGYQQRGDILSAAVTSKLILALDPLHEETRRRIPELVAGRDAELKVRAPEERPRVTSAEDAQKVAEAINKFYLRDLLPTKSAAASPAAAPQAPRGLHPIPLEGDIEDDFQLDIVVEEPISESAAFSIDPSGNVVRTQGAPPAAVLSVPPEPSPGAGVAEDALKSTLFAELPPQTFAALMQHVRIVDLKNGAELFHQGDVGDALYVVVSGTLGVIDEGPPRRGITKLGAHRVLGEIALLTNQPRTATILALTDAQLIAIDREIVGKLTAEDPRFLDVLLRFLRDRLVERLLSSNPLFTELSKRDHAALKPRFKLLEVDAGASLVEQDKKAEGLLILLAGHAEAVRRLPDGERALGQLVPGDVAGEISLLTDTPAIATVRATERSLAVILPAAAFHTIVKGRPDAMTFIRRIVDQRMEQARAILSGEAPHAEGRVI